MTSIRIEPYTEDLIPNVKDFNTRLAKGGLDFQFPEQTNLEGLLETNKHLYEERPEVVDENERTEAGKRAQLSPKTTRPC